MAVLTVQRYAGERTEHNSLLDQLVGKGLRAVPEGLAPAFPFFYGEEPWSVCQRNVLEFDWIRRGCRYEYADTHPSRDGKGSR
jgi:hypothetical protein